MTKYREILRLHSLGITQREIAGSCETSTKTITKTLRRAKELNIVWPLEDNETDEVLDKKFNPPPPSQVSERKIPNFDYIQRELKKNGVNKKLLWTEYVEECRLAEEMPLMYSQFCYYIQQDEQKRQATMHINRKPGEQIEVDWAGDPAYITDPDTGERTKVNVFVGVLSYSQYPYVEGFQNEKQRAWIAAHVHMFSYFGGAARILVPDNCKTAIVHNKEWYTQEVNTVYHEMAEHYNTAIIPARVRTPKDKPNAEGSVGVISTWIIAALRNEQFFSLEELNRAVRKKLEEFVNRPFQKKEGTRQEIFLNEEKPLLISLPDTPYELAEWKTATVLFNYHISIDGMLYSVPYEFIKRKVNVRITDSIIEIFFNHNRIASHRRLYGRKGQYSTITEHMPADHQAYLEWNGDRFRCWAHKIGPNTYKVINGLLTSAKVEQQAYRSCMGLLKLSEKYKPEQLEATCQRCLTYTATPSFKSIRDILLSENQKKGHRSKMEYTEFDDSQTEQNEHAIIRGSDYYRR